ncbi:MAG TPA: amidohydrolase family protein [Pyrinomonadaceae bacterium]|nr:amidohydrolase family protein [Pyrinomonadaceae bacterium]
MKGVKDMLQSICIARLCIIVLFAMLPIGVAAQSAAKHKEPIIDMHLHVGPQDSNTGKPTSPKASDLAEFKKFAAAMKRRNVVKAVVFGPLEYVHSMIEAAPDRIIGSSMFPYPYADPRLPDLAILREEYRAGRLGAMGEILVQYHGLAPNDTSLEPYFALAEELDIPVGIHMGIAPPGVSYKDSKFWHAPKFRMSLGNPLLLEDVLLRHPKLRLWVMHDVWPMLDELIGLLHAHPHVYADLAVLDVLPRKEFHSYLRRLVELGYGERLMYGSDTGPGSWPRGSIEAIESATFLTKQQKRDIFYNNAARFLRLGEERQVKSLSKNRNDESD